VVENLIGLALGIVLLGYLLWALIDEDRF